MADVLFTSKDFDGVQAEMKTLIERELNEDKINILRKWREGIQTNIIDFKEEQLQSDFLNDIFGTVLGYHFDYQGGKDWNLQKEEKTQEDATKADGALGFFSNQTNDVRAVIELKHLSYGDLDREQSRRERLSPVDQAFQYASKMGEKCRWVLVSNFNEIRLYRYPDKGKYETFFITELLEINNDKSFKHLPKFLYLLHFGYLFQNREDEQVESSLGTTERLYRGRIRRLKDITDKFYFRYRKFRRDIFENLRLKNTQIAPLKLFSYTQIILDRLIFMRFAGEVGLTERNELKITKDAISTISTYQEDKYWSSVKNLFKVFDIGYIRHAVPLFNGELFKENDEFDRLKINDDLVAELIDFLDSYDFKNDLRVEILGHIFEQSISDIEKEKTAITNNELPLKSEAKAEVNNENGKRKQDGVFYTPQYITAYMISETIGKWLQEKENQLLQDLHIEDISEPEIDLEKWKQHSPELTLKEVVDTHLTFWQTYQDALKSITVLDPACGSGAFLTEAFDFLLAEYLKAAKMLFNLRNKQWEQYEINTNTPKQIKKTPTKKKNQKGSLITDEPVLFTRKELAQIRKYIALNNLYGVDLNPESVGITKLSLYLKTADRNEPLADLSNNIKQGNSLISDKEVTDLAFDWEKEFPTVFSGGGFDIVVGNPPYGAGLTKEMVAHFEKTYQTFEYQVNSYVIFYEKGLNLLKMNGLLGYITPATFIHQHYFKKIRSLFNKYQIISICKYEYEVFDEATTGDTVSWVIQKKENEFLPIACKAGKSKQEVIDTKLQLFSYQEVVNTDGTYALNGNSLNMIKIRAMSMDLGKIANIIVGIKPYQVGKGNPKQTEQTVKNKPFTANYKIDESYYLCAVGGDFHRYQWLNSPSMYLSYGKWLAEPRESAPFFEEEKIILRQTSDSLIAQLDTSMLLNLNNVYNIGHISTDFSIKYILAILNSKLMNYIYQKISQERGKTFAEVKKVYLVNLPIADLSPERQQPLISLVNQVLMLKSQNQDTSLLEKEIDEAVYQIYGITGEEIKIIENQ
jgi:TaqI-like C-terminal specificity domain/Eco57I restriction-modification methylase